MALLRLSLLETVKISLPLLVVPTKHRTLPKVSFSTHLFVFKITSDMEINPRESMERITLMIMIKIKSKENSFLNS